LTAFKEINPQLAQEAVNVLKIIHICILFSFILRAEGSIHELHFANISQQVQV